MNKIIFLCAALCLIISNQLMAMEPVKIGMVTTLSTKAGNRLVAVGERGIVLLSDDAGLNWKQVDVPVSVTLTGVQFVSPMKGWAIGHFEDPPRTNCKSAVFFPIPGAST